MANGSMYKSRKFRTCLDCSGEIKPGDTYYNNDSSTLKKNYIYCSACAPKHTRPKEDNKAIMLTLLQNGPCFNFELEKFISTRAYIHESYKKLISSGINIKRLKYRNINKKQTTIYYLSGSEDAVRRKIENSGINRPEAFSARKVYLALNFGTKPKIS